jgi:hypothetical protein
MDILAHALYGVTCFSRYGLAGGRRNGTVFRASQPLDWTVWAAAAFGLLPDLASIGVTLVHMLARGETIAFHNLPASLYVLYHSTHSLITAGVCLVLLRVVARRLVIPALAWPLHIVMDSFSHGEGTWQTLMLYPFSDYHVHGMNWWQHPELILLYWGMLPVLWTGLFFWRRAGQPSGPR